MLKQQMLNQGRNYIHRGVAKRSFNLGYKIASKFDLSKAEAMMENGLLGIIIPYADEAKPKVLKIK
jgi:HSP20 family molecular chaperone IbpA